ncbi:sel1 repeat family protein [Rhizobium laguerreae]|uniref:tetratricopeptide repeat protein n=1 Tax=Rhizobium laguerreae TaxID=1076926 RepID=UPI001C9174F7|nr:tetratricopeptide repeat protein [Rhizobium laguerreae]MBY3150967.1 sel1 repeat family protein [Rhizobium laguerreae]
MRGILLVSLFSTSAFLASCSTSTYPIFPAETTNRDTATYDAAHRYQTGDGVPRDYTKATRLYGKASAKGDARAETNLGVMAMRGEGRSVNYSTAASHFRKAAVAGSAAAHYNLGLMYDSGVGFAHNPEGAVREYRIAAEQGLAEAQYRLAIMFENGYGTSADPVEAKRLFEMAAVGGKSEAYRNLTSLAGKDLRDENVLLSLLAVDNCDDCGDNVAAGGMAARDYHGLKELADKGDAPARYNLAVRLLNGDNANQDPSEAARLFTLAARQGYAPAQRQLAQMHLRGQAVAKSKVLAHSWLNLASKIEGAEAEKARAQMEELEVSMTTAEIAEAQKIAAGGYSKGR